jgi:hypothetical protein
MFCDAVDRRLESSFSGLGESAKGVIALNGLSTFTMAQTEIYY